MGEAIMQMNAPLGSASVPMSVWGINGYASTQRNNSSTATLGSISIGSGISSVTGIVLSRMALADNMTADATTFIDCFTISNGQSVNIVSGTSAHAAYRNFRVYVSYTSGTLTAYSYTSNSSGTTSTQIFPVVTNILLMASL